MDCLDEPLHLDILNALAANAARGAGAAKPGDQAEAPPLAIEGILKGLPVSPAEHLDEEDDEDDEDWTEFELNHAISYAHYVASLPAGSPHIAETLPRLMQILRNLLDQAVKSTIGREGSASGSRDQGAASPALSSTAHAKLVEALLKALLWVGWAGEDLTGHVAEIFEDLLQRVASMMKGEIATAFPLVVLTKVHAVLTHCALPSLGSRLPAVIAHILEIASPANLVNMVKHHSSPSQTSPGYRTMASELFLAAHPHTPSGVVMLVTEILNTLLTSALLPLETRPDQRAFAYLSNTDDRDSLYPADRAAEGVTQVPAEQTVRLLARAIENAQSKSIEQIAGGPEALREAGRSALQWWSELMGHDVHLGGEASLNRRGSMFTLSDGEQDEEIELSVAVLYLLNVLSLHSVEPQNAQLTRLRLLLSENCPVSDPRMLEAAFVCTSILVQNDASLGPGMSNHIRRLLMSPLPAFEGEMAYSNHDVPPAVAAASKCLAICMQASPNDDLISSTLYSLLNTLSHGTGTTIAGGIAPSTRSHGGLLRGPGDAATMHTSLSGGKKTEEQRRLVAVTAVEVVSRLALDIGRDDIIHLSISLLLQRLRGVDLVIEATIVGNLVPLALAGSNTDLIEVYRAFSQISRSAHPEDPRMSSNAVLAAQTTLAKGLGERLDCADGYLVELLTLFADKGTQTQMIAMAPAGFDTRDREKLSHLRADSESRVGEMKAWLAALLVPIATLLSHESYHPDNDPSPELVAHFRNLWFLCVVFGLSGQAGRKRMHEHEVHALGVIAEKTPVLVLESANDFVGSELEYNSILRKDFAHSVASRQRTMLSECIGGNRHAGVIREMSAPQTTFLLAVYDLEEVRTLRHRPSRLMQYFANQSINDSALVGCLDAITAKVSSQFLKHLSMNAVTHSVSPLVADEVCAILVHCTHRSRKVREASLAYAKQILESFAALLCDRQVLFTLLEILTLMRRSCEYQYTDEYSPTHQFKSDKLDLTLYLTDDYAVRNEITTNLYNVARGWLMVAIGRAPIEVQSTLQLYLNESRDVLLIDSVEMGAGLALHYSKAISRLDRQETIMPHIGGWPSDSSNLVASQFASKNYFNGELSGARFVLGQGLQNLQQDSPAFSSEQELIAFKSQMAEAVANFRKKAKTLEVTEIRRILLRAVSVLIASPKIDSDIVHYLVELPITAFTPLAIAAGVDAWTWLVRERPEAQVPIMGEIAAGWLQTIRQERGLFSTSMNYRDPFERPVAYSPSDKKVLDLELAKARRLLRPHLLLVQVLSSQFQAVKYREPGIMMSLIRLIMRSLAAAKKMSTHPLAREVRFSLLLFGFQILASSRMEALLELRFRDMLFYAAFQWFSVRPQWSFGSDRIQLGAEIKLLQDFLTAVQSDTIRGDHSTSSMSDRAPAFLIRGSASVQDYTAQHKEKVRLLGLLVENEMARLNVWCNPQSEPGRSVQVSSGLEKGVSLDEWAKLVQRAWRVMPSMAVHMGERFKNATVQAELTRLVRNDPKAVIGVPEALHFLLGEKLEAASRPALKWLPVWAAVPPVTALVYFQPQYGNHPLILQYAMRVLEQHPVDLTFFFVPQVVQALRSDGLGYVERFIFETSKISQLFCHQIIWNMKANTHRDDNATEEDPMKPLLDKMIERIVAGLSGKAKAFYDLEFNFFAEVTSISGKLKPYIKKSKPEKKAKIDEEMAKIELSVGVYLPSNPDGIVVDLDRKSGRPLQSHAKAPFMATFKVQKEKLELPSNASVEISDEASLVKTKYDVWQSAIFKVGDDCRQDVLALQIIAMFKNVFTSIGLVLYLFPYRVTATAPGNAWLTAKCGVIDVVPNATSRDEMGRAKINDLFSYFVDKYGGVDTIAFQKARLNFIQSMAAYSVACYILQIKDRHNGNIMIDGEGHIVHIDFGFLFDIGPGGIKFEPNSFKLNHEMVALMGGRDSQGYKLFAELTIKAFLAIRPHADQLVDACHLMLGTALPSFKGEGTIKRLRERFQLHLGERAAADYMMGVIRNAHENMRSNFYDGFQKLQNGIPY